MSNIEKDIRKINNLIERCKECKFATCEQCEINWTEVKAIERILAEREANKKKIEELEKENKRLKAKIDIENWQEKTVYESLKEKYIPKQKVKESLEYIEDYFDRLNGPDEDMEYIRNIKKELLEEE